MPFVRQQPPPEKIPCRQSRLHRSVRSDLAIPIHASGDWILRKELGNLEFIVDASKMALNLRLRPAHTLGAAISSVDVLYKSLMDFLWMIYENDTGIKVVGQDG